MISPLHLVSKQPCDRDWLCSVHLAWEKILKLRSNEDVVFLSGGECNTPNLAWKEIDRLLISTRCIYFSWSSFAKNSTVKRDWCGAILGWATSWEVFPGTHEWGQSALERLVLVCGASLQSSWVVTGGPFGRGVALDIRANVIRTVGYSYPILEKSVINYVFEKKN